MSRLTPEEHKRIAEIRDEINKLANEFRGMVKPTQKEIDFLLEDVESNPEVYTSYFEDDDLFLAENVYDDIVANEETENEP